MISEGNHGATHRTVTALLVGLLLCVDPGAGQSSGPSVAPVESVPSSLSPAPPAAAVAPSAADQIPSVAPAASAVPTSLRPTNAEGKQAEQRQAPEGFQERVQWPMVDVDRQRNKSTVDVHVPIFFDMVNHNDKEGGKSKLDLSVLQGLVTVNHDKGRDPNGQLTGPLKVTVFGIPVYTSKGNSPPAAQIQRELDNTVGQVNSNVNRKAEELAARVSDQAKQGNEKLLKSLSDIFERFSSVMRQTSRSLGNSQQQQQQQQQQYTSTGASSNSYAPQLQQSPQARADEQTRLSRVSAEQETVRVNGNKPLAERFPYDSRRQSAV